MSSKNTNSVSCEKLKKKTLRFVSQYNINFGKDAGAGLYQIRDVVWD